MANPPGTGGPPRTRTGPHRDLLLPADSRSPRPDGRGRIHPYPSGRINYKRLKKLLQAELALPGDSSYEAVEAAQLHFLRVFGEEIQRVSSFGASDPGAEALLDQGAKTGEGHATLAEWRTANREACRKILKKHRKKAGRGGDVEEAARPSLDYDEILETAYSKLEQAHQKCLETHLRSRAEAEQMMRVVGELPPPQQPQAFERLVRKFWVKPGEERWLIAQCARHLPVLFPFEKAGKFGRVSSDPGGPWFLMRPGANASRIAGWAEKNPDAYLHG